MGGVAALACRSLFWGGRPFFGKLPATLRLSTSVRIGLGFAVALSVGCAHVAKTDITPKGQVQLDATLGGPFANVPGIGPIPLPLVSAGASVGVAERVDVSAHLHVTPIVFGVGGLDVGASYMPLTNLNWRPAVLLTGRFYGFSDFHTPFRPYLELEATAVWRYAKRWGTYVTTDGFFQFQAPPIFNFGVGEEVKLGRVALQLETRWYQPGANTYFTTVDWIGIGRHGAIGLIFGIRIDLGGRES